MNLFMIEGIKLTLYVHISSYYNPIGICNVLL